MEEKGAVAYDKGKKKIFFLIRFLVRKHFFIYNAYEWKKSPKKHPFFAYHIYVLWVTCGVDST